MWPTKRSSMIHKLHEARQQHCHSLIENFMSHKSQAVMFWMHNSNSTVAMLALTDDCTVLLFWYIVSTLAESFLDLAVVRPFLVRARFHQSLRVE